MYEPAAEALLMTILTSVFICCLKHKLKNQYSCTSFAPFLYTHVLRGVFSPQFSACKTIIHVGGTFMKRNVACATTLHKNSWCYSFIGQLSLVSLLSNSLTVATVAGSIASVSLRGFMIEWLPFFYYHFPHGLQHYTVTYLYVHIQ